MNLRFPVIERLETIIVSISKTALFILMILPFSGCATMESWINPKPQTQTGFIRIENTPESEVRAAFVQVVRVAQENDVDAFKKLIEPHALPAFEDAEWKHPGHYSVYMKAIAADKPKDYHLDLTPSMAIFTIEPKPRLGDYSKEQTTAVILVRDGPQWKIGEPSNPMTDEALEPSRSKKGPPPKNQQKKNRQGVH